MIFVIMKKKLILHRIIKKDTYGLNNLNEHSAELPALDGTLYEQQALAR